ncbi:MAG TPA: glycosyltransferase family 2 protein [Candidatus Binatia bacterium]|nr:glycosyltransferase family 2 protein [Candidatus Binatia bacterium]
MASEGSDSTKSAETRGPELSIVIPAYNEGAALGAVLGALKAERLPRFEIVVVDDGSTDDTAAVAASCGARVIRHPYNIGNGAAVKTGLRAARGRLVVLMDGDGQHPTTAIPALLESLGEYHMVVAARVRRSEAGWHRLFANRIYSWFASYVAQYRVEDLTSGFRAMRRRDVLRFIDMLPNTFSYPTTLTLAFLRSGLAVQYVSVGFGRRTGESKINLWRDGTRFLLIISKVATLFAPFRVFLPVSASFFATGLAYYAYTFVTAHRFTNMAALLLSTSVVIFMLGLVSEQIAQLRMDRLSGALDAGDDHAA